MGARNSRHLTKREVEALEPRETVYRIQDDGARGLCIQVTPAGAKSWVLRYRPEGRRAGSMITLGRFPEIGVDAARTKAINHLDRISKGVDIGKARQAERQSANVKELAGKYRLLAESCG